MAPVDVVVTSYLEPGLVAAIADVDPRLRVLYDPALVPAPRYTSDHGGTRPVLGDAAQRTWDDWLGRARIAFDFDWQDPATLPSRAPQLEWVQATSAGIGTFVSRTGLDRSSLVLTTAAGVHGRPLAEFALTGVLHFVKGVPHLRAQQQAHRWERYTTRSVHGLRAVVIGLGSLGRSTCTLLSAVGVRVTGVGRPGSHYDVPSAESLVSTDDLDAALTGADVVVVACPLTEQTVGILSRSRLERLAPGAIVVNIARGACLDEVALLDGLVAGKLGGAALDVFGVEPLPTDSPLWDRDDVLVSPHSASTLAGENAAIVDLFCDNLRAWLDGRPLTNVYRRDLGY